MYEVVYDHGKWWISENGEILKELGGFIDPISPEIIVGELNGNISL